MQLKDSKDVGKLFAPLYRPEFPHLFGIDLFYRRQNSLREVSRDDGIDITSDDTAENVADIRNERYVEIIRTAVFCRKQGGL